MPYIDPSKRNISIKIPKQIEFNHPGELNFTIHKILEEYCDRNGINYRTINDIEGALAAVSKEFYRRIAKPYEKQKVIENGDITFYEKYGINKLSKEKTGYEVKSV